MVFSGTVESDFLKLVQTSDKAKQDLIDYSSTDFISLRQSLVDYAKAVYPLDYNNFVESDLGMMLIELVAYMGSVMSLKGDMLANENFLRTARNRNNVKKLLELIGVRMKGPISAATNAKISFTIPPAVGASQVLSIEAANRVLSITSSEDNGPLNFTLYKVANNGQVDVANADSGITFSESDADDFSTSNTGSIFTNFVLLEGALAQETGTFAATEAVKSIALANSPVVEGSVDVFIQGDSSTSGAYRQVDNVFFASGLDDKVFQVVTDEDFTATVVFGDNNLGSSPATGDDYVITYRVGGGTRGNIANEVINVEVVVTNDDTAVTVNATLENISIGTGGSDAETVEHAKKYAPLTFRRQDRIVTLGDFTSFANSFISSYGSVGKATASVRRAFSSGNIIDLFVLEKASNTQLRKATPAFKQSLLAAISEKKMLTDEIVVVDGLIRTLDLNLTLSLDKDLGPREEEIKLKARDVVLSFFSVDNNSFGKPFIPEELNRALFALEEIRFSIVDNVKETIKIDHNEIIQLNNLSLNVVFV